ncbi:MAG: putative O-glycosylation ligase, exosortase A system-associated [Pseudomonadota bacterium]|nr:putative O-glycosylation ligase, exosortase A system-associated [Pseudomonadota bacterium]
MRDLFVTVVVLGSLPMILFRPYLGILMWSWLAYMNPHKLSWGFARDFPFAMLVALVTLMGLLLATESKRVPRSSITVLLGVFTLWMLLTTLQATYPQLAWYQWDKVWKIMLMTFVIIMMLQSRARIDALIWVMAASIAFYGIKGGIFTLTTGGAYAVYGPDGTFIGGNNEIGLALIMTIPLLRYLQLQAPNPVLKRVLTPVMVLCFISVIGTQSRGALVAVTVMLAFFILKSRRRFGFLLLLAIVAPLIWNFMPDTWHDRMATIDDYQEDASAMGRINAWWMAFNLAQAEFFGGGFECFRRGMFRLYAPTPWDVHDAHSIYFEVLGEHGFVGLALFLGIGVVGLQTARSIIRETKHDPDKRWMADLAAMLQVSLIGYAAAGMFLGLAYFDFYYALLAILVAARQLLTSGEPLAGLLTLRKRTPEASREPAGVGAPAV